VKKIISDKNSMQASWSPIPEIEDPSEIFSNFTLDIPSIEKLPEATEFYPEDGYFIEAVKSLESEEKNTQANTDLGQQSQQKVQNHELISSLSQQSNNSFSSSEEKEKENYCATLLSMKKTLNKIIKETKIKIRIAKLKIEKYFEENTLEDIKKKTLKKIIISLNDTNCCTIRKVKNILKGKIGYVAFRVLMKLKLEDIYDYFREDCKLIFYRRYLINLSGKFDTLKDMMRKRSKKMRKLKLNELESSDSLSITEEESIEIENEEVSAISID
jgi:hypothetical protein